MRNCLEKNVRHRNKFGTNLFVLEVIVYSLSVFGYGDPEPGYEAYPSWQERQVIVLTNMVRMAPVEFRDAFLDCDSILTAETYPAVDPVYWNLSLNRSARAHVEDIGNNCGLQHNSCDGTKWSDRIRSYYKPGSIIAENISYGGNDALSCMRQWMLDTYGNGIIAPDGSEYDGHRANIMNSIYHEIGTGYELGKASTGFKNGTPYWVQDLGGGESIYDSIPVPAGSHFLFDSKTITFLVNYCDKSGTSPVAASLVLAEETYEMSLRMGSASRGTYGITQPIAASCRRYHFQFIDGNGTTWTYPTTGCLQTLGEGDCESDYCLSSVEKISQSRSLRPIGSEGAGGRCRGILFLGSGYCFPLPDFEEYYDLNGCRIKNEKFKGHQLLIKRN